MRLIRDPDAAVASIQTKQNRSMALGYFQYAVFYSLTNFLPNKTVYFEEVIAGDGLKALTDYLEIQTGILPISVDPAEVKKLMAERTNFKNRPTKRTDIEANSNLTKFFRSLALGAFKNIRDHRKEFQK